MKQESAPGSHEDAQIAALKAGDEAAFHELFERTYPTLKGIALGYVDSEAVAEEVVQETWLAVVNGIGRFEGRSALGTWIFSILTNQAKTHHRRECRARPFSSTGWGGDDEPAVDAGRFQRDDEACRGHWAVQPPPWQKPDRRLLSLEARVQLKEALAQLPARQSAVVGLRDVDGFSAEEVCDLLDLSAANQRVLRHRGRLRLRAILEPYLEGADT